MRIRLLLLFCVLIWGWTFVATKICLAYMNPIELVGLRFGIGLPLLLAIIRLKRVRIEFSAREFGALAIGGAVIVVHFIMQGIALTYTSATNTGWIIAVTPLALTVLSFLILKETIGRRELTGISLGTIGVLLLISGGRFGTFDWLRSIGDWMILASTFTWSLYTIATRDVSRARNPMTVTLAVFTPVMLICMSYVIARKNIQQISALPPQPLIALAFLGVLGTLTQWLWQVGISKIGAARAGIFLYIEPLATTLLAVPLLHESVGIATVLGGFLVLAGVWWSQFGVRDV